MHVRCADGRPAEPCPPPSTVEGPDPRIAAAAAQQEMMDAAAPRLAALVPSTPTGPEECQDLMALDFKSQYFQAFAHIPSYSRWLVDADLTPTYAYERRTLKLLQWGQPRRPWRLKCPTHLLFLPHLDKAFPDARYVWTHRDPTEVILSVADLYAEFGQMTSNTVDRNYLGQLNVEQWSVGMRRALEFRDVGNDDRFFDLDFAAVQRDPIGEVKRLYAWLDEPVTAEFEAGMQEWWRVAGALRLPRHASRRIGLRVEHGGGASTVRRLCRPHDDLDRVGGPVMTVDVTGGLIEDWEYVWARQPEDSEARESVNAWIWDDNGSFGIPRVGIEAVADQWDTHDIQVNLAFADGRVFNVFGNGPVHDPLGADGKPRILGAGPLSFEMVEPYRHLRLELDGQAIATTVDAQMAGWTPWSAEGDHVAIKAHIDIRPVLPPWENGSTSAEARHVLSTQEEGYLIGYPWRFEQLCRATGSITVGSETYQLDGGANRIRRQGVRRLAPLRGHVWQAAAFPSGFGFGSRSIHRARTANRPTTRATSSRTANSSRPESSTRRS